MNQISDRKTSGLDLISHIIKFRLTELEQSGSYLAGAQPIVLAKAGVIRWSWSASIVASEFEPGNRA